MYLILVRILYLATSRSHLIQSMYTGEGMETSTQFYVTKEWRHVP